MRRTSPRVLCSATCLGVVAKIRRQRVPVGHALAVGRDHEFVMIIFQQDHDGFQIFRLPSSASGGNAALALHIHFSLCVGSWAVFLVVAIANQRPRNLKIRATLFTSSVLNQ